MGKKINKTGCENCCGILGFYLKIVLIFCLFYQQNTYGQGFSTSEYEKKDIDNEGDKYRKLLKLDANSLLVNFDGSKFIALTNGKVIRYVIVRYEVKSKEILKGKLALDCKRTIDSLLTINPDFLSIKINAQGQRFDVQDGGTYKVEVYKNNAIITYFTRAPSSYIEHKVLHYEHRVKLVNAYYQLKEVFSDEKYKRIKSSDTVYVYFEKDKNHQSHKVGPARTDTEPLSDYHYRFSNAPHDNSMTFEHNPNGSEVRIEKKSFLKKNKDLIITYDYLNRMGLREATLLIGNKKVYLIDKKDFCRGKIKLKKVKVFGAWIMKEG
ncbi:hypothetical protein [Flavobacterium sp. LAR06]|uniref:hypothetical protein n=1 Tax=Flavobacterium sp. LAR06 TaxID=3064897 RepID=UPI0035C2655E